MFFLAAVKFPQTTTEFSSLRPPNMTLQTDPKIHQTISNQNQRLKSNETKPEDIHLYYLTHTRKLNYTLMIERQQERVLSCEFPEI
jgi:hypothetical protein